MNAPFKRAGLVLLIFCGLAMASGAYAAPKHSNKAASTKHTVKVSARPFKTLGHAIKDAGLLGFAAFDTSVIDPLGVALQAFADGLDMFVAAPLESLPEPFEAIGDGAHYVYLGIDKAGQVLAR